MCYEFSIVVDSDRLSGICAIASRSIPIPANSKKWSCRWVGEIVLFMKTGSVVQYHVSVGVFERLVDVDVEWSTIATDL